MSKHLTSPLELPAVGHTDLAYIHPNTGERWIVEAKGKSMAIGMDFNCGLGQLLKRMHDDETAHFGLAMPDIPAYRRQAALLRTRVRRSLGLHWVWVNGNGSVSIVAPDERLS